MTYSRIFALQTLLTEANDVNARTNSGKTALMIAIQSGHVNLVSALIKEGAEVNMTDNKGRTALMLAAQEGQIDCVKILLAAGAEIIVKDKSGRTALMFAAQEGHDEIVRLLEKTDPGKEARASTVVRKIAAKSVAPPRAGED